MHIVEAQTHLDSSDISTSTTKNNKLFFIRKHGVRISGTRRILLLRDDFPLAAIYIIRSEVSEHITGEAAK